MGYIKKTKKGYAYGGQVVSEDDLKKFAFGGGVGEDLQIGSMSNSIPSITGANYDAISPMDQEKAVFGRRGYKAFNRVGGGDESSGGLFSGMRPSFKDGGQIEGAGTGKSDSITAKVKGGSFVVPAENADVAKDLRKKVLKAPSSKKANLNQKGGEKVKLSNGEHLFTPEEVEELKTYGYDVDALAPNSDDKTELKNGGLTAEKARQMLHDKSANGHPLTEAQRKYFGWVAGGSKPRKYADGGEIDPEEERAKIAAEKKRKQSESEKAYEDKKLRDRIAKNVLKRETEKKDLVSEINRLNSGLKQLNDEYNQSTEGLVGYSPERETARKEAVLGKIEKLQSDIKNKSQRYNFVKEDKNYTQTGEEIAAKSSKVPSAKSAAKMSPESVAETGYMPTRSGMTAKTRSSAIPTNKPTALGKRTDLSFKTPTPTEEEMSATAPNIETPASTQIEDDKQLVDTAKAAENKSGVPSAKIGKGLGKYGDIIGAGANFLRGALNYYLPYKQMQMGKQYLAQAGARPVGHIDPEFQASVNRAQAAAKYGYTPEEQAYLDQQNIDSLNAQKAAARNYSGGSAGNAYNMERQASNDFFGRGLQAKIGSRNLQLQKQNYADQLVAGKADMNRQLFEDTLQAWKENQKAGGALLGAGINNMIGANRYNSEISAMRQAGNIESDWTNSLPTQ